MKMYSVKDGELECREVDADFFEKNTTLGGLLTSDEVELDRDNKIIPDSVDMASCDDLTVTPLLRFPYLTSNMMATEGQDLDFRSMYPEQLTMDTSLINKIVSGIDVNRDIDYRPITNIQIHDRICLELNNIYEKKNADYGNSFENSLDKHGLIAGIVRMDDKMSRLISLNSKNKQLVLDESLRDTLMDLANYAIMSVMWLDEQ